MSGRPKNTDLGNWATGNYSAPTTAWDGQPKRVAPVVQFFEPKTLLDPQKFNFVIQQIGTAVDGALDLSGQDAALNWRKGANMTYNATKAAWSPIDQAWIAYGNPGLDTIEMSYDTGRTWVNLNSYLGGSQTVVAVTCSSNGDIAAITDSGNVYHGIHTTFVWTNNASMMSAAPAYGCNACFDATHNKYVAVYRRPSVGRIDYTLTPSVAWTAATLPAAWSTYVGTKEPDIAFGGARLIAAYLDTASRRLNIMRSTDGAITWSNVQVTLQATAAALGANSIMSRPTYDETSGRWYVAVSSTSDGMTEILMSSDGGATWTTAYRGSLIFQDLQAIGSLLIGLINTFRIGFSTDGGGTWYGSQRLTGTATQMWLSVGGGGVMSINNTDKTSFFSARMGIYPNTVIG